MFPCYRPMLLYPTGRCVERCPRRLAVRGLISLVCSTLALYANLRLHPERRKRTRNSGSHTLSPHPPACLKALSRDHLRRPASPSYYLLRRGTLVRRMVDVQASVPFRNGLLRIES